MNSNPSPQILRAITSSKRFHWSEKAFNQFAVATYAWQWAHNPVYRRYCEFVCAGPTVRDWREIPALPVSAFKTASVACFKPSTAKKVFRTSGTTQGKRGAHHMQNTKLYDAAIRELARRFFLENKSFHFVSLVPPVSVARDSSLSYMIHRLHKNYGVGRMKSLFDQSCKFNIDTAEQELNRASHAEIPVAILATSHALAALLDELKRRKTQFKFPKGSRLFQTGGFKGRHKEVSPQEMARGVESVLGIGSTFQFSEYGMTELSSHFYRRGKSPYAIAPWTRVVIVDPDSGEPVRPGARGLIRICDLANQSSVATIQTEDEGRLKRGGFELLGRRPGSGLRGCSLTFEESQLQ